MDWKPRLTVLSRRLARTNHTCERDRIEGELKEKRKRLGELLLARDKKSRPAVYRH
jgi:hypothetical protein